MVSSCPLCRGTSKAVCPGAVPPAGPGCAQAGTQRCSLLHGLRKWEQSQDRTGPTGGCQHLGVPRDPHLSPQCGSSQQHCAWGWWQGGDGDGAVGPCCPMGRLHPCSAASRQEVFWGADDRVFSTSWQPPSTYLTDRASCCQITQAQAGSEATSCSAAGAEVGTRGRVGAHLRGHQGKRLPEGLVLEHEPKAESVKTNKIKISDLDGRACFVCLWEGREIISSAATEAVLTPAASGALFPWEPLNSGCVRHPKHSPFWKQLPELAFTLQSQRCDF